MFNVSYKFDNPLDLGQVLNIFLSSPSLCLVSRKHPQSHYTMTTNTIADMATSIADMATYQDYVFTVAVFDLQTSLGKMYNPVRI